MSIAPITPPVAPVVNDVNVAGLEKSRDRLDLAGSFEKALSEAHAAEDKATHAAEQFARGDAAFGIHEVVIASEKANIAVRYATTLKNKALDAYRELMNTQV